jgi:hypothetical protein
MKRTRQLEQVWPAGTSPSTERVKMWWGLFAGLRVVTDSDFRTIERMAPVEVVSRAMNWILSSGMTVVSTVNAEAVHPPVAIAMDMA